MESESSWKIRPRHSSRILHPAAAFALLVFATLASAAGDEARGATMFQQCAACHSTIAGEHMSGPSLAKIWHRKAGTTEDFRRYSDAMRRSDVVWNEATLDKWLTDPETFIPGTTMTFAGLSDSRARADVIAYLEALSEGKAPKAATRTGGMMMNMQSEHRDLKAAPAEGQVTAIKHCGDTYEVSTADGKTEKVWEFNLRFKTDSSKLGPNPGKPVIIGAGMQGDRASVVFAAPSEISRFVAESCP
jgi:cytochrome c